MREKEMEKNKMKPGPLSMMIARTSVMNAAVNSEQWEPLTLMVDSGASDTVIGPKVIPGARIKPSPGSSAGLEYEVASGEALPNLGEKDLSVVPHGGSTCRNLKLGVQKYIEVCFQWHNAMIVGTW